MINRDMEMARAGLRNDLIYAIQGAIAGRLINTGTPPRAIDVTVTVRRVGDPVDFNNLEVNCRISWPDGTTTP